MVIRSYHTCSPVATCRRTAFRTKSSISFAWDDSDACISECSVEGLTGSEACSGIHHLQWSAHCPLNHSRHCHKNSKPNDVRGKSHSHCRECEEVLQSAIVYSNSYNRITLQCTSNDSSVLSSKRVCKKCSVSRKLESIEWCTKMWHGLDWLVESSADANNRSTYTKSNMWTSDTGHWTGTHNINQQSIVPNHVNILPKTTSDNSAQHIKKC